MSEFLVLKQNVFTWSVGKLYMIYNCSNGRHHIGEVSPPIVAFINEINELSSLYRVKLPDFWQNSPISSIVSSVLLTDSGDIYNCDSIVDCPVSIKPVLKVQNNLSYVNKCLDINAVIETIQCITIHLGGVTDIPFYKEEINRQILYPIPSKNRIDISSLKKLIDIIPSSESLLIRLLEFKLDDMDFVEWLFYRGYNVVIVTLVKQSTVCSTIERYKELLQLGVSVEAIFKLSELSPESRRLLSVNDIKLRPIVADHTDIYHLTNMESLPSDSILMPFVDVDSCKELVPLMGIEPSYFEGIRLSKRDIFVNSAINTNYFGHIEILATGEIMDAIGFNTISNLNCFEPKDLLELYREESPWFQTRSKTNCKECIYQHICIPPSKYENSLKGVSLCFNKPQYLTPNSFTNERT